MQLKFVCFIELFFCSHSLNVIRICRLERNGVYGEMMWWSTGIDHHHAKIFFSCVFHASFNCNL